MLAFLKKPFLDFKYTGKITNAIDHSLHQQFLIFLRVLSCFPWSSCRFTSFEKYFSSFTFNFNLSEQLEWFYVTVKFSFIKCLFYCYHQYSLPYFHLTCTIALSGNKLLSNLPQTIYLFVTIFGTKYPRIDQVKLKENSLQKFLSDMVCLGRACHFKFFKGCLPQISLGPFLNTFALTFYFKPNFLFQRVCNLDCCISENIISHCHLKRDYDYNF